MKDVEIKYLNEATCYIETSEMIMFNLKDKLKFHPANYWFSPKYKNKIWDGYIYLIKNNTLPVGLIPKLCEVMTNLNVSFIIDSRYIQTLNISKEFVKNYAEFLNVSNEERKSIKLREHQLEGVYKALINKRMTGLSATNSGKSLIIYTYIRFLIDIVKLDKILLLVPNVSLVEQMFNDFKDYSLLNKWDVEKYCQKIYSDIKIKERDYNKQIIISTWQSIHEWDIEFFKPFKCFICDEVHLAKGNSIQNISGKCINASYRLGVTGSLSNSYTDELIIRGAFGSVIKLIDNNEMIDKGYSTPYNVKCILLKYNENISKNMKYLSYNDEIDFLLECIERNKYIAKLAKNLNNNTLVLFEKVKKHGIPLFNLIKCSVPEKKVLYIDGNISNEQRLNIINYMKTHNDVILIASYGTFSTGINLKNLYNLIFASPFRSKIRLLQSLGRMLRKMDNKNQVNIYDLVDDLSYKSYQNNVLDQFISDRLVYYDAEKTNYKIYKINIEQTSNENYYIEKAQLEKQKNKN